MNTRVSQIKNQFNNRLKKVYSPTFSKAFSKFRETFITYITKRSSREILLLVAPLVLSIIYFCYVGLSKINISLNESQQKKEEIFASLDELNNFDSSALTEFKKLDALKKRVINSQNESSADGAVAFLESLLKKELGDDSFLLKETGVTPIGTSMQRTGFKISFTLGDLKILVNVIKKIMEDKRGFSIARLKLEKTSQDSLAIEFDTVLLTTAG
jgi:hypothetical protein